MALLHLGRSVLDRRRFLRGALAGGAAVAVPLPILDAMLGRHGDAFASGAALPVRFGVWFFGNGINPDQWRPMTVGANWAPAFETEPLADAKVKPWVTIVSGTNLKTPSKQVHGAGPSAVLTGTPMVRDGEDGTVGGKSIDMLVADQIGGKTFLKSLELASTKGTGAAGSAFKWISHNGPDNPNVASSDPREVWKRVFNGFAAPDAMPAKPDPRLGVKRSILDAVVTDAQGMRSQLGTRDRARVDQHLTSLRELERRLADAATMKPAMMTTACRVPASPATITDAMVRTDGLQKNLTMVHKLQSDLLAMALACDRVRVFTLMFSSPASHDAFPEVKINETFHETFHRQGASQLIQDGVRYEMARLADTVTSLAAVTEGAGNLLDNCAGFATSCIGNGQSHGITDYPFVTFGRAGGKLKSGLHVRDATGMSTARLTLTVARAAGAMLPTFGSGDIAVKDDFGEILG